MSFRWPNDLRIVPLVIWPSEETLMRGRSPYRASFGATIDELRVNMRAMDAIDPTLQVAIPPSMFRGDGYPRADAVPRAPGVVLLFARLTKTAQFPSQDAARDHLRTVAGVGPSTPLDDRTLYRKAALASHPDRGGSHNEFWLVEQAWSVISNPTSYRLAADHYDRWQDNLRAIAKTLTALRAVDRYGVVQGGEQYAGFKQLAQTSAA